MNLLDMNLNSVAIFSCGAVSSARDHVRLTEEHLSKTYREMHSAALAEYNALSNPNEADYEAHVGAVDRAFNLGYKHYRALHGGALPILNL